MKSVAAPILFDRQKRLLNLLDALGGDVGNLDFQKLLLLFCSGGSVGQPYEFVPYKFGAFSFTSYADRRKLINRGLLADEENRWQLTDSGRAQARQLRNGVEEAARFALTHKNLRGDGLVAHTYRTLPYYATRSEIVERILKGDADALNAVGEARPAQSAAGLATVGYEGRTFEAFLNVLIKAGVTVLCDVRRNPLSRKYGFSKGSLSRGVVGVGIRYEHIPALGIASDKRRNLESAADYRALFDEYERESLPSRGDELIRIREWVEAGETVALMCYELDPQQCHRHCVGAAMNSQFGASFAPRHL